MHYLIIELETTRISSTYLTLKPNGEEKKMNRLILYIYIYIYMYLYVYM